MGFAAGQQWTYAAPAGFEDSRLVIGAIVEFSGAERIICCSVTRAPRRLADGTVEAIAIPFLPMTETAFAQTVLAQDGAGTPPPAFLDALVPWQHDPLGLTMFTVPFEGQLDRLIARQMAAIADRAAA
jgi:hypothetical protein